MKGGRRRGSIPAPARLLLLKVDGTPLEFGVWSLEIFKPEVLEQAAASEPEEVS